MSNLLSTRPQLDAQDELEDAPFRSAPHRRVVKSRYLLFCGPEDQPPRKRYNTVSFRIPRSLSAKLHALARAEDMTFSQFVRRGLRRELLRQGIGAESLR
jgi:hypothetical protein